MSSDIDTLKLELQPFVKRSVTTANGNVGGTTLIDSTLVEANDFWNGCWVLLRTGTYAGQLRQVTDFDQATNTITLDHTVGGRILAGVQYVMSVVDPLEGKVDDVEVKLDDPAHGLAKIKEEVVDIEAKLGEIADPEAEAGAGLPRLLWIKNGVRRGAGTILPLNTSLYDCILTRAAPGDAMALTAAERLIVQALIINDLTPFAGADIGLIRAETDKIPNVEHETEWASVANCDSVTSDAATNLTVGPITPTFPTGSTRVRAILVASIHILNLAANTHHIAFRVEGNKDGGGYSVLLNLMATAQLGLVNLDGATEAWCGAIDVTALVNASGSVYNFRFVVDSDNAGAVRYITCFTLVLVYTI